MKQTCPKSCGLREEPAAATATDLPAPQPPQPELAPPPASQRPQRRPNNLQRRLNSTQQPKLQEEHPQAHAAQPQQRGVRFAPDSEESAQVNELMANGWAAIMRMKVWLRLRLERWRQKANAAAEARRAAAADA